MYPVVVARNSVLFEGSTSTSTVAKYYKENLKICIYIVKVKVYVCSTVRILVKNSTHISSHLVDLDY